MPNKFKASKARIGKNRKLNKFSGKNKYPKVIMIKQPTKGKNNPSKLSLMVEYNEEN